MLETEPSPRETRIADLVARLPAIAIDVLLVGVHVAAVGAQLERLVPLENGPGGLFGELDADRREGARRRHPA